MWWRCGGSQNGRWKRFGEHRCELLLEIIQNLRPHSSERERAHLADDLGGTRDQDMNAQEMQATHDERDLRLNAELRAGLCMHVRCRIEHESHQTNPEGAVALPKSQSADL